MTPALYRCEWAPQQDPDYLAYHDEEWGVPVHDRARFFEMLTLEGAQAGLSWSTILHKREGYRRAFAGFDVETVAAFDDDDGERLMANSSIVRNRLKITSTRANARAILELELAGDTLDSYLWSFVAGAPLNGRRRSMDDIPSETGESRAMSKDLKRRGFRFVGPTVCYAFMQATGLVNDHVETCFRFRQVGDSAPGQPV